MADEMTVVVLGCGNMGAALADGFARAHDEVRVLAIDRDVVRASSLLPAGSRVQVLADLAGLGGRQPALVVVALKPQVLGQVLPTFRALCADALVVSIAAGITCRQLAAWLGDHPRIVRAMPNLPVVVGQGMSTLFAAGLSAADRQLAEMLFAAVGDTAWLTDETAIDLATAVAGSGPAYVFALVEHLASAGETAGLPDELAMRLARQTVIGAAAMLQADQRPAAVLKHAVCSPGGTTEAGLAAMEGRDGLPAILRAGVAAAARRAGELAGA